MCTMFWTLISGDLTSHLTSTENDSIVVHTKVDPSTVYEFHPTFS